MPAERIGLIDRYGESELIYDFPNEKWENVWEKETKEIVDFCNYDC